MDMTTPRVVGALLAGGLLAGGLLACSSDSAPAASGPAGGSDTSVSTDGTSAAPADGMAPGDALGGTDTGGCIAGAACDDGDPCTVDDVCDAAGACGGTPKDCDDGLDCTEDSCAAGACEHVVEVGFCATPSGCVAGGGACDDGDACTTGDVCSAGTCTGTAVTCDAPNTPCLDAVCDPAVGCLEKPNTAPCEDGNPCTAQDTCAGGICTPGPATVCDDNDACTKDVCDLDFGCQSAPDPTVCDDHDPCTVDTCDPAGPCGHAAFDGPCEDGNPCTEGETCAGGTCGGGTPVDCEDGNPCTAPAGACDPEVGCTYWFVDGACSDGFSCTQDDACVAGLCVGAKLFCPDCAIPTTDKALKVVDLKFSADGKKGSALDIDGDPTTCSPAGSCSDGVDNALSSLAPLLNGPMGESMASGALMYVVDLDKATFDGQPFPFAVYDAKLSAASTDAQCDFQVAECGYTATQFSFGPDCHPYFGLPDVRIVGDQLIAGGPGSVMTIAFALGQGILIPLTLVHARVRGNVVFTPDGKGIQQLAGIIGGATPKAQLIATFEAMNPAVLPVDKATILALIDAAVVPDIDLDGDGEAESASLAIRFITIPAHLE